MMYRIVGILLLVATGVYSSTPTSLTYIGAVVEYRPVTEGKDGRIVSMENAAHVRTIVKKATEYNVDIIVFPEIVLNGLPADRSQPIEKIRQHYYYSASYVPSPDENIVLCDADDKYAESLKSVSCTARDHQIYIVVNHYEKLDCQEPNCSPDNFLLYNTNVVFDREGRLIARYRKYNLFSEPGINITSVPEISIFQTDFGVTFGQIICNDILYMKPTFDLLKEHNITDIIYSAEWFSELPFLTSVQTHSAWAYVNDVNVLSSGFNEPAITNGGSGIYLGKEGIAKATIPTAVLNELIVVEIPKIINGERQHWPNIKPINPQIYDFSQEEIPTVWDNTQSFMYKDIFDVYTTELIDPNQSFYNKTLCNRGLCCDFKFKSKFDKSLAEGNKYYRYRIGVFDGTRLFAGLYTLGIEVCGLFFCRNENLSSCGDRFSADTKIVQPTTFHSISIERANDNNPKKFFLPMTLRHDLLPVHSNKISFTKVETNKTEKLKLTLKKDEEDLFTFAIYGRNLANDGSELTKP